MDTPLKNGLSKHRLLRPWITLLGMAIGVIIGLSSKSWAHALAPWGDLYISFIRMTVLPIIITAIITSIDAFFHSESIRPYVKMILFAFFGAAFCISIIGVSFGFFGEPGKNLSVESEVTMGRFINQSQEVASKFFPDKEVLFDQPIEISRESLFSFISKIIPDNIFQALVQSDLSKIVFFSIIFGIALGFLPDPIRTPLSAALNGIFNAFAKIIKGISYLLPLGVGCYLAGQASLITFPLLLAMFKYMALLYAGFLIIMAINSIVIARSTGSSLLAAISSLKETLLITFAVKSPLIALPFALREIHEELKVDRSLVNLLLPFGFSVVPFGAIYNFALTSIFFAQIYNVHLGFPQLAFMVAGAILAGVASSSAQGIGVLTLYSILFDPFNIPLKPAFILLIGLGPLLSPTVGLLTVHTNTAVICFINRHKSKLSRMPSLPPP